MLEWTSQMAKDRLKHCFLVVRGVNTTWTTAPQIFVYELLLKNRYSIFENLYIISQHIISWCCTDIFLHPYCKQAIALSHSNLCKSASKPHISLSVKYLRTPSLSLTNLPGDYPLWPDSSWMPPSLGPSYPVTCPIHNERDRSGQWWPGLSAPLPHHRRSVQGPGASFDAMRIRVSELHV